MIYYRLIPISAKKINQLGFHCDYDNNGDILLIQLNEDTFIGWKQKNGRVLFCDKDRNYPQYNDQYDEEYLWDFELLKLLAVIGKYIGQEELDHLTLKKSLSEAWNSDYGSVRHFLLQSIMQKILPSKTKYAITDRYNGGIQRYQGTNVNIMIADQFWLEIPVMSLAELIVFVEKISEYESKLANYTKLPIIPVGVSISIDANKKA